MYARLPQAMAQFGLKIEKLSHIMGTAPILEMARAYGLRPRLWLLPQADIHVLKHKISAGNYQPIDSVQETLHCLFRVQKKKRKTRN